MERAKGSVKGWVGDLTGDDELHGPAKWAETRGKR
jgi:uncharacterized protein YjbJ (UPF0337 family)